jgi:hypothetical protein
MTSKRADDESIIMLCGTREVYVLLLLRWVRLDSHTNVHKTKDTFLFKIPGQRSLLALSD